MNFYVTFVETNNDPRLLIKDTRPKKSIDCGKLLDFLLEKNLEYVTIVINPFLPLNEDLFTFLTTKLYKVVEKQPMDILFTLTGTSLINNERSHKICDFVEKLRKSGMQFDYCYLKSSKQTLTLE